MSAMLILIIFRCVASGSNRGIRYPIVFSRHCTRRSKSGLLTRLGQGSVPAFFLQCAKDVECAAPLNANSGQGLVVEFIGQIK
ncbi:hypothetical protein DFH09DRAFT_1177397 [Mycena vulgaris]|nr:hypothetical protein DFH09DRAFT_1177397 [Mycena vulgaris]